MSERRKENQEEPDLARVSEFVELYSANYPRVQYYLRAILPSANDAADVLQETSLVLWRKFHTFQSGTNFFAWACKIARLQAMKHRERLRRHARILDDEVIEKIADEAAQRTGDPSRTHDALMECMKNLREEERSMILDRYQPDASVGKMAEELGMTANKLSKLLAKIRFRLLDCVKGRLAVEYVD